MAGLNFRLQNWAAWRGAEAATVAAEDLPALLRRRVGPLGRRALGAAWRVRPAGEPRFVFSSRHGEFDRTFRLLQALASEGEVSPAEFSLSVHNALAGLLSIAAGNRRGHTTIAAGRDSFGCALLEAAACLAEEPTVPVLAVHYDEPLPEVYAPVVGDDDREPVAIALVLSHQQVGLALSIDSQPAVEDSAPQNLATAFIDFLNSEDRERTVRGGRTLWRWRRV